MHLPNHVAIIMDGNGRWAERQGLPRLAGHQAGVNRIPSVVKTFLSHKVKYLTLYGFSSENWNRPEEEVQGIFNLLEERLDIEAAELHRNGIKFCHIGRLYELPSGVQSAIERACQLTKNNNRMTLCFAFNYGGRIEITDAARKIIEQSIPAAEIDEKEFARHLYTAGMPDVDLVIRTGGEQRISNLLLWQAAYAEFYFTKILWPNFTPAHIKRSLEAYARRERRFGGLN
jgi:undecaprenyl diphosphate synthase